MDDKLLVELGFNEKDAAAYRHLLLRGSLRPLQLQKLSGESRANCYAILERLVEIGLAKKEDENKKLIFYAENPQAIESLVEKRIAENQQMLKKVQSKMPQMLSAYGSKANAPKMSMYKGKEELLKMYTVQMEQGDRELYFVRSIADIAFFGIAPMKEVRRLAPLYKKRRYGITPMFHAPSGPNGDKKNRLTRTWLPQDDYRNPVEWAVSGDVVQAIVMSGDGYGVSIEHKEIAESFRTLLKLLSTYIKKDPDYKVHPRFEQPSGEGAKIDI